MLLAVYSAASIAIPSLQLSGDGSSAWSYDPVDETWVASGSNAFTVNAYANAANGNGKFAWDSAGAIDRFAYLTVAAVPDIGSGDSFDITVAGATLVTTGYGKPPIEDHNGMSPHSIYDTYFEIYEFQFDGPVVTISDQQPGGTGTGLGYVEMLDINVNSVLPDIAGLHFDLFTVSGSGVYVNNGTENKKLVHSVAPYSHDAAWNVPEPQILLLMIGGLGVIGLGGFIKRR